MSQRRRRGHEHTRGSCIIYSGGTTAVLPLSLVQQTSMEITRTDPHGFSTTVHHGFTMDTAVLLWIHTDLVYIILYMYMCIYIHKYSIHVYRPWRMAFEAGRGGSGLEPKTGRTSADPGGFRRTPPPDPPGPRTDPGRTRHRTIRTRGTGGAHSSDELNLHLQARRCQR